MKFSVSLFVSLLISACVGMPISSILKLRQLDPLETDPASISIAIITHNLVELKNGAVSLTTEFTSELPGKSFSTKSEATIVGNAKVVELETKKGADEKIILFFLGEAAARSMKAAQHKIKDNRLRGIKGDVSLLIEITSGCFAGPLPDTLLASIYVKYNEQNGYIVMNSELDLLAASEQEGQDDFLLQCSTQH